MTISPASGTAAAVSPYLHRIQNNAIICELKNGLSQSLQKDDLTQNLKSICEQFQNLLKNFDNPENFKNDLVRSIQLLLEEEQYYEPSNRYLLGSDGHLYGYEQYQIWVSTLEDERLLNLSPITQGDNFFLKDHEAANFCRSWLAKHSTSAIELDPDTKDAFNQLDRERLLIPLPTGFNQDIRLIRWRRAREHQEQNLLIDEIDRDLNILNQSILPELEEMLSEIKDESEISRDLLNRFIEARLLEYQERFTNMLNQLDDLEDELEEVNELNQSLNDKIEELSQSISFSDLQIKEIQSAIVQIEAQIRSAKKKRRRRRWTTFVFIGTNAVLSFITGAPLLKPMAEKAWGHVAPKLAQKIFRKNPLLRQVTTGVLTNLFEGFPTAFKEGVIGGMSHGIQEMVPNPYIAAAATCGNAGLIRSSSLVGAGKGALVGASSVFINEKVKDPVFKSALLDSTRAGIQSSSLESARRDASAALLLGAFNGMIDAKDIGVRLSSKEGPEEKDKDGKPTGKIPKRALSIDLKPA